jgi:peroxiredoxin
VGAALLALTAGWVAERLFVSRGVGATTASARPLTTPARPPVSGEPAAATALPPRDSAQDDDAEVPQPRLIPEQLPVFTLNDLNGKPTSIAKWRGQSLVLNFWATWCAPCQREIPLLKSLAEDWQTRDVTVVGVAVDHRAEVLSFADKFRIDYPLLIGEQDALDAAAALGVDSPVFPFTVFTDRRGEVVALFVGELHRPQAELILKVVQDLNQDRVNLAAAKHQIAEGLRARQAAGAG